MGGPDRRGRGPCVHTLIAQGGALTLGDLLRDPRDRERPLPIIPLLLTRGEAREVLPDGDRPLRLGDRLLLCGCNLGRSRLTWTLQNLHALDYLLVGASPPEGLIWRWLFRRGPATRTLPSAMDRC